MISEYDTDIVSRDFRKKEKKNVAIFYQFQ